MVIVFIFLIRIIDRYNTRSESSGQNFGKSEFQVFHCYSGYSVNIEFLSLWCDSGQNVNLIKPPNVSDIVTPCTFVVEIIGSLEDQKDLSVKHLIVLINTFNKSIKIQIDSLFSYSIRNFIQIRVVTGTRAVTWWYSGILNFLLIFLV